MLYKETRYDSVSSGPHARKKISGVGAKEQEVRITVTGLLEKGDLKVVVHLSIPTDMQLKERSPDLVAYFASKVTYCGV